VTVKVDSRGQEVSYQEYQQRLLDNYSSGSQDALWGQHNNVQVIQQNSPPIHSSHPQTSGHPQTQGLQSFDAVQEEEEDFFQDMVPKVKHQKRILLNNPSSTQTTTKTNKFSVDETAAVIPKSIEELGDLDDSFQPQAWEEDFEVDIDSRIREARDEERKRRRLQQESSKGRGSKNLAAKKVSNL